MRRIILFFLLALSVSAFAQQPYKQAIHQTCEVTFPDKPVLKTVEDCDVYSKTIKSAFYLALVKSSGEEFLKDSIDVFYKGVVDGNLKTPKGELVYKKDILIDGLKGLEFEFIAQRSSGLPNVRFQQILYVDKQFFTFSFWTYQDSLKINEPKKSLFFNSIHVIADKNHLTQGKDGGFGYVIGNYLNYPVGKITALVLVSLLIFGATRFAKRKKIRRYR